MTAEVIMKEGKIVLVDDNLELMRLLAGRLREEGYEIYQAEDGQKGLLKVQAEQPDLLIVDLQMPRLPGHRMIKILRDDRACRDIPIIMLSAFVTPEMRENVEAPADFYITKPFDETALMNKIDELITKRRGQSSLVV